MLLPKPDAGCFTGAHKILVAGSLQYEEPAPLRDELSDGGEKDCYRARPGPIRW